MALGSVTAKNRSLSACYGDAHSSVWPATLYLAMFDADPLTTGVELTAGVGGYARLAIDNDSTNFAAPVGGAQANAADFIFPGCTDAWSGTATHWAYMDDPTDGEIHDCGPLDTPFTTSAGDVPTAAIGSLVVTA
jgi:hypothetical protein